MISRVGLAVSRVFQRCAPDPFVIAIFLTLLTAVLALLVGDFDIREDESRVVALLDAWRAADSGLWKFLAFGMQMCLILVTGHALASSRPIRSVIDALAGLPHNTAQAAGMVAAVACVAALINWGLGIVVGALLAREVGRALAKKGRPAHYPLICAAGYMGLLVWHGGLSGSAPLSMTTAEGAAKVLPQAYVDRLGDVGIPLQETLFSGMNLIVTAGLVVGVPILLMLMAPSDPQQVRTIDDFDAPEEGPGETGDPPAGFPDRIDNSPVVAWLIALPLLLAVGRYVQVTGPGRIGLNQINAVMLALGLILHGSPRAYMNAVTEAARGCAGIIIQFPLYGGIMAMMVVSGLVGLTAEGFVSVGNETTIPLLSFLSAGVVNLFVPSGGGQWGIQGPIALQTGLDAGIAPGKMVMAVAYGDQLTNMLQPFWALPLLGITGCRARDIVGYTAVVMVFAAAWMAFGLLVF